MFQYPKHFKHFYQWLTLICLALFLSPQAWSHGGGGHSHHHHHHSDNSAQSGSAEDHVLGSAHRVQALAEQLELLRLITRQDVFSVDSLIKENELSEVGKELLSIVSDELEKNLLQYEKPQLRSKVKHILADFLAKFNPVKLGRWVVITAREHGVWLALGWGMSEVISNAMMFYSSVNPRFSIFIPMSLMHVEDVIFFGIWFGLPKLKNFFMIWLQHGSLHKYFLNLLRQRKVFPVDWGVSVDLVSSNLENLNTQIAITDKKFFERKMSNFFGLRHRAQESATDSVDIRDLERFVSEYDLGPRLIQGLKWSGLDKNKIVYSQMLLKLVLEDQRASDQFRKWLERRRAIVVSEPINARSDYSPDLVAVKVMSEIRHLLSLYQILSDQNSDFVLPQDASKFSMKNIYSAVLKLRRAIKPGSTLDRLAQYPFQVSEIEKSDIKIQSAISALQPSMVLIDEYLHLKLKNYHQRFHCEELLLSASSE